MENALDQIDSPESVTLVYGTADEIRHAFIALWAPADIVAKSVSFLVKLPGRVVSKVEGGFQIGNSFLPISKTGVGRELDVTHNRFAWVLAVNDGRLATAA